MLRDNISNNHKNTVKSIDIIDAFGINANKDLNDRPTVPYTLYRKRWLMLFLYYVYCVISVIHWMQYSVIADVVVKYYSVSYHEVEWTTMIFSMLYIIFSIPGSFILDKMGLRISVLIGAIGTCVGAWMKVVAVHPNRFWLVLLSQCIVASFQVLILPVPPKLAAVWFGPKEIPLACTIAAVAIQITSALGFIFPPLLVKQGNMETMQAGFYAISYGYAIPTTVIIVILYFLFEDEPATPPSFAQQQVQENKKLSFDYKKSLLTIIKNRSFLFLLLIYGVHLGASAAIVVLLNQMILEHYSDASKHVGYLGLLITCFGVVGPAIYGVVISKFGGLKFISWFIYACATIAALLFVFLIDQGLPLVYILGALMGAFWSCIYCVGFELGAELTYPEPEAAASGLLTNSLQLFSVVMTYAYSYFYNDVNKLCGNLTLMVILVLADMSLFFIKFNLKRSEAESLKAKLTISLDIENTRI